MPVSSKEIAARAGVSQATVSRVINDRANVRDETRRRVLAIIEELGYVPDAGARSLVTQRTTRIGLIVSDILNPFYPELVDSVEEFAREKGYTVLLCNTRRDPANDQIYARYLMEQRVAGVLLPSVTTQSSAPAQLAQAGIPFVFVSRTLRDWNAPAVLSDNVAGGYLMSEYLLKLGHRQIAFIRGLPDTTTSQDRELGYCRCLSDWGVPVQASLLEQGDYTRRGAYAATLRLLSLKKPPTAILNANDYMAFGALDAAADWGIRVPAELSIVGYDNITLSSLNAIGLTTVEQPIAEMARRAMEILLSLIDTAQAHPVPSQGETALKQPPPQQPWTEVYAPRLVVRTTSGKPPSPETTWSEGLKELERR